ncbi:FecR family protein [Kordiimonas marina]|uniref:FecR family protein n=1 Tax=Kordiimonas marina TaxID=2872312 RepID=UPI001FF308B7|nr:FecR domain-containing protein [Kordiimonas marina]MCJ9427719.1 FecR domain-containing protein [Kordiimonas marina]
MAETDNNKIDPGVLNQAADYYLSLEDGSMTAAELKAWQTWLQGSDNHRRAFRRMETLWGVLAAVPAKALDTAAPAPEAAAPVAEKSSGGSVLSLIAPKGKRAQAEERERRTVGWMMGMAASVAAVFLAGYLFLASTNHTTDPAPVSYATVGQEQRVVKLADGSIVELGPRSSVSVFYTAAERHLTLQKGQAVFTVAKNPRRPFVVQAGGGSVTAIGTVFNVRKLSKDVEVRVLEGTVAIRPVDTPDEKHDFPAQASSKVALVTAGNVTGYTPEGTMRPVVKADVHRDLAWRVGVLTMVDWRLGDVIHELNRYLEHEITIGDQKVKDFRFTGTVYPDQVQAWLDGLQEGYPIKVVHLGTSRILMMADKKAGKTGARQGDARTGTEKK